VFEFMLLFSPSLNSKVQHWIDLQLCQCIPYKSFSVSRVDKKLSEDLGPLSTLPGPLIFHDHTVLHDYSRCTGY